MLITILSDQYSSNESWEIADALSDLCSPDDPYGWSSAGLYCFWNPIDFEILYIGLSINLGRRFCEHNNLVKVDSKGTKQEEIGKFFASHQKLGFSVLLQAPLDQPDLTVSAKERLELPGFEGIVNVKNGEGTLLKAYKNMTGKFPAWNRMGGAKSGAKHATKGHFNFFKDLSEMSYQSVMRSDLPLRVLAKDAYQASVEMAIHGLRIPTIGFMPIPMPVDLAIATNNKLGAGDAIKIVTDSERGKDWIQRMREFQKNQR